MISITRAARIDRNPGHRLSNFPFAAEPRQSPESRVVSRFCGPCRRAM
jgi:hypothetical protein